MLTNEAMRQATDVPSITNCPATAGVTAAIQRSRPKAGPAMPKKACTLRAASPGSKRSGLAREAFQVPAGEVGVEDCAWAPASARDSPWRRFNDFSTCGGMYFSSCLASTSSATNVPSPRIFPCATTPVPSRNRSGNTTRVADGDVVLEVGHDKLHLETAGARCTLPCVTCRRAGSVRRRGPSPRRPRWGRRRT